MWLVCYMQNNNNNNKDKRRQQQYTLPSWNLSSARLASESLLAEAARSRHLSSDEPQHSADIKVLQQNKHYMWKIAYMFANTYHLEVEKLVSFCESVMRRNMETSKLFIFVDFNFLVKPCFPFHDAEFKLLWSVKHFLHAIKLLKRTKSHELAYDISCKKQSHQVWAFLITDEAIVRRITFKRWFLMAESYLYCNNHSSFN